jgi:hypothetical protein
MKATTHFRRRGNEVLLFYLVVPAMLFGQGVRIHERVEISPSPSPIQAGVPWQASITGNTDHRIIITASWDKPVEGNIYMKRDFGPSAPCSETTLASGISQIAVDTPLSAGNYQFKLFICVAQLAPSQACSASFSVMIDEQQIGRQSWVVYGGSSAIWESIGTIGYNSPYVSTFTFKIDRKTMYYEEGNLLRVSATNDCRLGTFDLAKDIVQLEIVGGAVYAQFFNFDTWQMAGTSVSGLVSGLQKYSLVANGSKPDPAGSTVSIRASSGSLLYTETVTIVPYYFRVTADTPRVYAGGGTSIKILTVNGAGEIYNRPASPVVRIGLTDNNDYGTLWYGIPDWGVLQEGDTVEGVESMYLSDPSAGTEVDFLANERQPKDSVVVKFNVEKIDEGSSPNNWSPWVWPHQGIDPITGMGEVTVLRKEEGLDHFALTFERDTICHGENSSFLVAARDAQGRDVDLDKGTLLKFTIDSTQYGSFISAAGDTVPASLENVLYSDAKDGNIKFVANKINPIGLEPSKVTVTVIEADDAAKSGEGTVKVKRKVTVAIQQHAPWTIWPYLPPQSDGKSRGADRGGYNPKRTFSMLVLDGLSHPVKDEPIRIFTKYEETTGGHSHINGDKALPQDKQGTFYSDKKNRNPLELKTNATGGAIVDSLLASQIAGKFLITVQSMTDTTAKDTVNLEIRVPGLVEFGTGAYWTLTGTTSNEGQNHLSNHWCTQTLKDSVTKAVKRFYEWTASKEGGGKAIKLGINDMGLEMGGVFDIKGNWNLNREHSFHRIGLSIDIDKNGMTDEQLDKLTEIIKDFGGVRYKEPTIHYGFDGGI